MNREILQGDVLEKLKEIPTESIDCIITSPPHHNLRDYSVEGQMGLEPSFKDFLKKLHDIMVECKRVLKNVECLNARKLEQLLNMNTMQRRRNWMHRPCFRI